MPQKVSEQAEFGRGGFQTRPYGADAMLHAPFLYVNLLRHYK